MRHRHSYSGKGYLQVFVWPLRRTVWACAGRDPSHPRVLFFGFFYVVCVLFFVRNINVVRKRASWRPAAPKVMIAFGACIVGTDGGAICVKIPLPAAPFLLEKRKLHSMGVLFSRPVLSACRAQPNSRQRMGAQPWVRWQCVNMHAAYGGDSRGSILGAWCRVPWGRKNIKVRMRAAAGRCAHTPAPACYMHAN